MTKVNWAANAAAIKANKGNPVSYTVSNGTKSYTPQYSNPSTGQSYASQSAWQSAMTPSVPKTNATTPPAPSGDGMQNIQSNQDNGNAQIDADYNQSMGMLDTAETGLRGQAETAVGDITSGAASTKLALGEEQAAKTSAQMTNQSTAEKQGKNAMTQARDLFRQTQQTNNAQMSALGISSSSVSEALAERLGVETARRIAGVTGNLDEVRQNVTQELGRIKSYYSQKATDMEQWVTNEKAKIQNTLLSGLNQINTARQTAASDKASARANLLSQVQTQIYNLTTQQQQFQQSLQTWAAQKSSALTPLTDNTQLASILSNAYSAFAQTPAFTQFGASPTFTADKYGQVSGTVTKKKEEDDNLF